MKQVKIKKSDFVRWMRLNAHSFTEVDGMETRIQLNMVLPEIIEMDIIHPEGTIVFEEKSLDIFIGRPNKKDAKIT